MTLSRYVCIRVVCCVVLFTAARAARAESQFGFDLDYCCEQASMIMLGQFTANDEFEVKEFLFGGKPQSKTLPVAAEYATALRTALQADKKATIEALVFLDKDAKPVLRESGLVGFHKGGVAIVDRSLQRGLISAPDERFRPELHPKLTRDDVLHATRQLLGFVAERRELMAQPPSMERITHLLDMLRKDLENRRESKLPVEHADFQVAIVAKGLRPMNRTEEPSVIQAMCGLPPATQEWRIRLLKLAEVLPLSGDGFEAVANWIGRDNPRELRVASIKAMARVNRLWASDRLIPLLSLDDECLPEISDGLSGGDEFRLHNRRVVDALGALVKVILKRDEPLNRKWLPRLQPVLTAIGSNFHPRLLPDLIEWSTRTDDPSAVEAAVALRSLLGFERSANDLAPILAWWKTAHDALERNYDLSRAEGVADWLIAYENANVTTRRVLDVLWLFEPRVNESYLLQEAKSDKPERAATAKVALRTLWTMELLSASTRGRIADAFLTVELIEIPAATAGSHELKMVLHRKFPLPMRCYLESSVGFSNDGSAPILKDGGSSRDAVGEGEIVLGGLGGGSIGEPNSRYAFSLREFDHRKREVVWTRRWDFGQKDVRKVLVPE